ncbi:helix-turn-helix transcriptional regulator [Micromonospora sp. STR1_7]|uniref:Helix-turn-helix transcriptional regulator n=1 Tax=Micromonospora parastrephiae TaxID=2806101 RepID=A0ABS1XPV2_9ACTN|nr:helix-turn-helix domain-containing protein [Micromonospora parastrephiae]MBM0231262.1 helix-turn-helix transcriptional regulator [Micromonospora parastrephiae]
MDATSFPANRSCPIARTVGVLGQKWNFLLLREAFLGRRKFAEFQRIGVPTATLGARLKALVDAGLLDRRTYRENGERSRDEYVLTDAGRAVMPVLAALIAWGEAHLPAEQGTDITYAMTTPEGRPVRLEFVDDRGAVVDKDAVAVSRLPRTMRMPA